MTPAAPKPVHLLTREEAAAELETLLDAKPPEDQVVDRRAWGQKNQERVTALQAWLMMHPDPASREPQVAAQAQAVHEASTRAPGIPKKSLPERLQELGETLLAIKENPNDKKLRVRFYNQRHIIRGLPEADGLPLPDLPNAREERKAAPAGPKPTPTPTTPAAPASPRAIAPIPEAPIVPLKPTRAFLPPPPSPRFDSLSGLRAEVWDLLHRMEAMTPEGRAELRPGISLLLSGVTQALQLASGYVA